MTKTSLFSLILLTVLGITNLACGNEYKTTWRGYFNLAGLSITVPEHLDARTLEFAFVYRSFGLGTKGFRLYNNFNLGDSVELAGFIAPAYLYYVPFGSHRKTGDITPMVMYLYAGLCAWGLKQGMLVDFGLGFNYYLISLRIGYNGIRTESRIFFDVDDPGFNDWPISWRSFYISFDLFPGFWISLKSKLSGKTTQGN